MEPTIDNISLLRTGGDVLLSVFIPKILAKLRDERVDPVIANAYIRHLRSEWTQMCIILRGYGKGWSSREKIFMDAGFIETALIFIRHARPDLAPSQYYLMDAIQTFVQLATMAERRRVHDEFRKHHALDIFVDIVEHSPLATHRCAAVNCVRLMAADLFLGEALSPRRIADLMETMCKLVLAGPHRDARELLEPDKNWQSRLMCGREDMPARDASQYAKRYYSISQEYAMLACHGLLCRAPVPSREHYLAILRHNPGIVDSLLRIAQLRRTDWYPESKIDALACEVLALLVQFRLDSVPGLNYPLEGALKEEYDSELRANVEALDILLSRPNWANSLLDAWSKTESFNDNDILAKFKRSVEQYFAVEAPNDSSLKKAYLNRGRLRTSILRIIASVTYSEEIKDDELITFLRPAYIGAQANKRPVGSLLFMDPQMTQKSNMYASRSEEVWRVPGWANTGRQGADYVQIIGPETLTGPLALTRLYTLLHRRGLLSKIQSWTALPADVGPSTELKHVKQITNSDILKKALTIAVKRITTHRELGRDRLLKDADLRMAMGTFIYSAELAAALRNFDQTTDGKFAEQVKGARKELVLCLTNAAEMALRQQKHKSALAFASAAAQVAQENPQEEGLTMDIIEKNKRRLVTAKGQLQSRT
ncbi:hypothetical protein K474DRAFT_1696962 [Panus rudis PR-1116 ss-1]|nr:hypothetical protein K474DRAFT_1696962 [Panus rudis PR-1116 ss-1]